MCNTDVHNFKMNIDHAFLLFKEYLSNAMKIAMC